MTTSPARDRGGRKRSMAEDGQFTIHLEHLRDFEFNVRFD